jgi:protein CpxP
MKHVFKSIVVASLLATAGFSAMSQGQGGMGDMGDMGKHHAMAGERGKHQMDPKKMEAMVAKRTEDLRAKLKITAAQEGAWTAFTTAMKPPANGMGMGQHPNHAEMEKLSTPERIDKMKVLRVQHHADMMVNMDKRDEAVKTFYATLSTEQKATFDAEHARMGGKHGKHGK